MNKFDHLQNITVIGAGSWGTSIAIIIAENHPQLKISIWAYEKSVVSSINKERENTLYLPGVLIPENVNATSNLKDSVTGSDIILFATPSKVIYDISLKSSKYIHDNAYVGILTKGLCKINHKIYTISQALTKTIPKLKDNIVAIYGPSHAEEINNKYHTCLNVAGRHVIARKVIIKLLSNDYLQCRETNDILGVEIGGTLKNPAAIAAGMLSKLPNCGDNLKGALISEALKEMLKLSKIFKARDETIIDISGLGDLVATAMSEHSRNRRFGEDISKQFNTGKKGLDLLDKLILKINPENIIEKMSRKLNYLAEGAYAIEPLIELAETNNISIPVYRSLYEVLLNKKDPSLLIETIKNPEKYEQIYSETKIQISHKKVGLEKVKGYAYKKIMVNRTLDKFIISKGSKDLQNSNKDLVISNLKEFKNKFAVKKRLRLNKIETRLIDKIDHNNFKKTVKNLVKLYVNNITDNFNSFFNWLFLNYLTISNMINSLRGRGGNISLTGSLKKAAEIDKSANIIYVPTYKNLYDFILLCFSLRKLKLPFPRFFVSREIVTSTKDLFLIKLAGGYLVNPHRMSNVVYKETLCEYISIMVEHGIPLLYFPEHKPNTSAKNLNIPSDFFEIIMETLYKHTVEIVLIPVEINYLEKPLIQKGKKINLSMHLRNRVDINFSDPVYLSEYTKNRESVSKISEIIKTVWSRDTANSDYIANMEENKLIL